MQLPPQAYLEITRRCNQSCPFCSCPWWNDSGTPRAGGGEPRPEMDIGEWKSAATELIANGVRYIAVTGGEPTLKAGAQELIRHIAAEYRAHCPGGDHVLSLFSNGKDVSRDWLALLRECGAELYTSLPGLQSFAAQTGEPAGGYRHVLPFIYAASEMDIPVSVGVTITKAMLPELYEVCSYAVLSGAKNIILNLFKPSGRGLLHPELYLSEDDVRHAAATANEVASKCGAAIRFGGEFPSYIRQADYPRILVENSCIAARETFTVAPDGFIHVCEHDPRPLCHWRQWRTLGENPVWQHCATHWQHVCPIGRGK